MATDPTVLTGSPVLAIAKSHTGSFVAGQTGTYALLVSNTGNVATSGTITVTDSLPAGLSYVSASGTGWSCSGSGATATCTSSTVIAAGASGNPISLTVNVAASAPATVTNTASASGGGASNTPTASDPTTILRPVLAVAKSHSGNFAIGQPGTYTIAVSNTGTAPTSGTTTIVDTLPAGLTYNSASGSGWSCSAAGQTVTCATTVPIPAGGAASPISLTVNVVGPPGSVTNTVTASGGGATNSPVATDPTTLTGSPVLAIAKSHSGSFSVGQPGAYSIRRQQYRQHRNQRNDFGQRHAARGLTFSAASGSGWSCSARDKS